jgi:hypothetical protein
MAVRQSGSAFTRSITKMVIHDFIAETKGVGKWEVNTTRYVPVQGGSRSRLSIGSNGVRRYYGFVGIDENLTERISTVAALYGHLGGGVGGYPEGSYMARIIGEARKWIQPEPAEEEGQ